MQYESREKILCLENKQGEQLTLRLRPYCEGDEAGMIACIREEYGDTYFKQDFYNPEYLKKKGKEGSITFLVAETEQGSIAGMMILKEFYPEETMCEIASQIFRKKYRGYGLAMAFFEYGMEILLSGFYSAAFCLPVLFHNVTQKLLYRLGLRATGLILNVFDVENISHSYDNGRNRKHSQGIQIKAVGKKDAGILYLPIEHQAFCQSIYDNLGVDYQISKTADYLEKEISPYTVITCKSDEQQKSLEIQIHCVGADLEYWMKQIHLQYPLTEKRTAGVFINCNDSKAVWAYEVLWKMGYFFTGLKPLCSHHEYMVLHHPGEVDIYFEDYQVSEEFAHLIEYIKKCYEERCKDKLLFEQKQKKGKK